MNKTAAQIAEEVVSGLTSEMRKHFEVRTKRHISLVQKYCKKLEETDPSMRGLVSRGTKHDDSKFGAEELLPYIWLTWRYKCQDDNTECNLPEGMQEKINKATEHHILNNAHHPEYHQDRKEGLLNTSDRDKTPVKIVDATKMSNLDIGEMVADWAAMSEERGNTPREWADKNVNVRWKFTPEQKELIYRLIDNAWSSKKTAAEIAAGVLSRSTKR